MKTKKVSKKLVGKLVSKSKSIVEMIEYSIEMTIPTGNYANIRPCIVVKAGSPEEAHEYIAPHMNKLWKEYFMVNERRVEVVETKKTEASYANTTVAPTTTTEIIQTNTEVQPPSSNVAVIKATQAIESCTSLEALELIENQVELSVKLDKKEKPALRDKIIMKFNELNADKFIEKNNG